VGLGSRLVPLREHENVKKENSAVIQAYRTLIIAFRSNIAAAPGAAVNATGSTYVADPDIDKILSKLTVPQLVQLINNLARAGNINLRDFLMKKNQSAPAASSSSSSNPNAAAVAAGVNMTPPPKPPAPKAKPSDSDGKKKKKKVDLNADGRVQISARAIVDAKDKLKITRKLIDQGVVPGKKLYESSPSRWHEEFQAAVQREKNFLKVVYEMVEIREYEMTWQKATKLLNSDSMRAEHLADALIKVGFGVKRSLYMTDRGEVTEWEAVILPQDLPLQMLLKAIIVCTR